MKNPNILWPITDLAFLKKLIPHREPLFLIDTLHYHDVNKLKSSLLVLANSLFVVNTHFSEAGILEHMAQSVALHTGYSGYLSDKSTREGYIGAIKNIEISQLPKVGETIVTEVSITYSVMDMTKVQIESKIEETVIATAEMSTILKPLEA